MQKNFVMNNTDPDEVLSHVLEFIHEQLAVLKLDTKDSNHAELMCEEAMISLITHGIFSEDSIIRVNVSKFFGNVKITMTVPGQEFTFTGGIDEAFSLDAEDVSPEASESIRNMLLRSFGQNFRYRHSGKYNIVIVSAVRSRYSELYAVLGALVFAVIAGLLMRTYLPESVYMTVNDNVFAPVRAVFLNGLKLCAVPVVFLSIALCMADSGSMSGIKRTGSKVLGCFLTTQMIALMIGFGLMLAFRAGEGAGLTAESSVNAQAESVSLLDTVVNIIPSDIVRPFFDGNMLQIIALAVIFGVSAGLSSAKSITNSLAELNGIFTNVAEFFLKLIPLVVFCSIASMVITTGTSTIFSVLGIVLTILAGHALLHLLYILMVKFIARKSPAEVYREAVPALITSIATCSTVAALPESINAAKKLGIPSRIYSFTLPLGISAFKNESCIYFIVAAMSAANMYGIHFASSDMVYLAVYAFVASLATLSAPCGGLMMLSMVLTRMGCPLEFVPLFVVVDTFTDMSDTAVISMQTLTAALTVS